MNILFETLVKYKKDRFDTKLVINDSSVIFEKKRLFSKDKYRIIDSFNIEDIISYKDKIQIKNNKTIISIKTNNKKYSFICSDMKDTKKIIDTILNIKTGKTKLERRSSKAINSSKKFVRNVKAVRGIGSALIVVVGTVSKHKKEFKELFYTIKDYIKK